jgi:hypothetical protein
VQVDFMIVGAMKCGTSSLSEILALHPGISFSEPKEPQFFSKSGDWKKKINEYHSCFSKKGILYGEGSTNYTKYPAFNLNIYKNIFEYNNKMKFIYLIRNPIDRIISHYIHIFESGLINISIEDALIHNPELLNVSRYYTQIIPYIRKFGEENVFIILFEEFVKNQFAIAKDTLCFLGMNQDQMPKITDQIHANNSVEKKRPYRKHDQKLIPTLVKKTSYRLWEKMYVPRDRFLITRPTLSEECKSVVINMLELEILAMQDLIKRDLSSWFVYS